MKKAMEAYNKIESMKPDSAEAYIEKGNELSIF